MRWMLASTAATLIATCGSIFKLERVPTGRRAPALRRQRWQLRLATTGGRLIVAEWQVSLPRAIGALRQFTVRVLGVAWPARLLVESETRRSSQELA